MSRYLCSELVVLKRDATQTVVNLEEIWSDGAVLDSDYPVAIGAAVELESGENRFKGTITSAEQHEFGWRIELAFAPETQWSPEIFRPRHMMDPEILKGEKVPD